MSLLQLCSGVDKVCKTTGVASLLFVKLLSDNVDEVYNVSLSEGMRELRRL